MDATIGCISRSFLCLALAGGCEFLGHSHEVGKRFCAHLLHDVGAMKFDCSLGGSQLAGDLFVEKSCGDKRRHFALAQLSLPRDKFPNLVESAEDTAEVWLSDPDHWWRNTVDVIMFGLERMLERSRDGSRQQEGTS